jgi:hypothetical protein
MIQHIVDFLGYCNARSLNQTCKLLHQCVPPSIQEVSNCDLDWKRLENDELALSEGLILKIPLDSV